MIILAIESSCDDTAVTVFDSKHGMLANNVYSQDIHENYGGVFPEFASREHLAKLPLLIDSTLKELNIKLTKLDAIAYTWGPGLIGSLLVGASFAKGLAYSLNIPAVRVNHLEGHILSPLIEQDLPFPFLSLLISGGNTQLILVNSIGNYQIVGETLDDSVGEAFDKVAKLLGLGYPGGAKLEKLAKNGNEQKYKMPLPMFNSGNLNFSFSGLKTHVLYLIKELAKKNKLEVEKSNIAASFQFTATNVLIHKTQKALQKYKLNNLIVSGGVSANNYIKNKFNILNKNNLTVFFPSIQYCTDNAAMIANVGFLNYKNNKIDGNLEIEVDARVKISN